MTGEVIVISMNNPSSRQSSTGVVALQYVDDYKKRQARELRRKMTEAESVLWEYLRRKSLQGLKFRRQQIIEGFIADFFCEKAKLVVEVDGGIHETEEQKKIDEQRRAVFEARGLIEIRIKNEVVLTNIEQALRTIKETVCKRIAELESEG